MLQAIIDGFAVLCNIECIISLIIGVVSGMVIGIIPGLGPSVGVALLIPITFNMHPAAALTMMAALYTSGVYGGSITATLCKTPGTAASAATALDGYELTKQGRGMEAISVVTIASVFGGLVGGLLLLFFAPPLGRLSLRFSALEYFLVACFGLLVVSGLVGKNLSKGLFSAALGLLLGTVGLDPITGVTRFTFGSMYLENGIDYTPVLVGLFSMAQGLILVADMIKGKGMIVEDPVAALKGRRFPTKEEFKTIMPTMVRSSLIGTFIGFVPAAGAAISSWINYSLAKKFSKTPEKFGHGALEGITASEAANNSACGGAMIPLFTLGIPGSAVTAIMYGGLLMHGMVPGNSLFTGPQAGGTYAIFVGYILANILMGILGLSLTKQFSKVCLVPNAVLVPIIISFSVIGTYALNYSMEEVLIMILFGVIGFFMKMYGFETPPLILGMVLCGILESNYRRALILARGNLITYFFNRPIAMVIMVIIILFALIPVFMRYFEKRNQAKAA